MKPIIPTSVMGTRNAPSAHNRSGKRVLAVRRIAAWTAIHILNRMLKKRTRPGAEAVHPRTGRVNATGPGTVKGKARAANAKGMATYARRAAKNHPRLDNRLASRISRKKAVKVHHAPSGARPTAMT